jgi:hypothetical protein
MNNHLSDLLDLELQTLDFDILPIDSNVDLPDLKLGDLPSLELDKTEQDPAFTPPSGNDFKDHLSKNEKVNIKRNENQVDVKFKNIKSFADALGSENSSLLEKSLKDLIYFYSNYSENPDCIEENTNFNLSIMDSIKPQDPLGAIMLKQILMTHSVINKYFSSAVMATQTSTGKDINISRVTKLIRSFNAQVCTYIKYTRGGHQRVTVQHINVSDGSQAIIGNVAPSSNVKSGGGVKNE